MSGHSGTVSRCWLMLTLNSAGAGGCACHEIPFRHSASSRLGFFGLLSEWPWHRERNAGWDWRCRAGDAFEFTDSPGSTLLRCTAEAAAVAAGENWRNSGHQMARMEGRSRNLVWISVSPMGQVSHCRSGRHQPQTGVMRWSLVRRCDVRNASVVRYSSRTDRACASDVCRRGRSVASFP